MTKYTSVITLLFKRMWNTPTKFRLYFIMGVILIMLTIIVNLSIPLILKTIIEALQQDEALSISFIGKALPFLLVSYGLAYMLSHTLMIFRELSFNKVIERTIRNFYHDIFHHIMHLDLDFHLDRKTGEITNSIERFQHSLYLKFFVL